MLPIPQRVEAGNDAHDCPASNTDCGIAHDKGNLKGQHRDDKEDEDTDSENDCEPTDPGACVRGHRREKPRAAPKPPDLNRLVPESHDSLYAGLTMNTYAHVMAVLKSDAAQALESLLGP